MTMSLSLPLSLLLCSLHPRTRSYQKRPQVGPWGDNERKRERREAAGQLHVSAHFTAQAFSLNKMLSGGEKGRRTKATAPRRS